MHSLTGLLGRYHAHLRQLGFRPPFHHGGHGQGQEGAGGEIPPDHHVSQRGMWLKTNCEMKNPPANEENLDGRLVNGRWLRSIDQ